MRSTKKQPKSGQFVEVWEAHGKVWSNVHKWEGEVLLTYNHAANKFVPHCWEHGSACVNLRYYK